MIETDYLTVGAGATGMAFADSLIAGGDTDVVMVDRRHSPGGHWNDAYSFVKLHQPSANYGVSSRVLGTDSIDTTGLNARFYDRASGVEICDYFRTVLEDQLLTSGQVRFYGMRTVSPNDDPSVPGRWAPIAGSTTQLAISDCPRIPVESISNFRAINPRVSVGRHV